MSEGEGTNIEGEGGGGGNQPVNYFATEGLPETWRQDMIGVSGFSEEDAPKRLAQLERFTDIGGLAKSFFDSQDKIRQGLVSTGLPENATEDQLAEYRTANNIPLSVDDYEIQLADGLEMNDAQGNAISLLLDDMHSANISNDVANSLVNTMIANATEMQKERETEDGLQMQQSEQALRGAWGAEYDKNVNITQNMLSTLPEAIRDDFAKMRMPDGSLAINNPEMFMWLTDKARALNPTGTVVPNSANPVGDINKEIAELEAKMGTDEWFADKQSQDRYQKLVTVREEMKKRP